MGNFRRSAYLALTVLIINLLVTFFTGGMSLGVVQSTLNLTNVAISFLVIFLLSYVIVHKNPVAYAVTLALFSSIIYAILPSIIGGFGSSGIQSFVVSFIVVFVAAILFKFGVPDFKTGGKR